MEYDQQGRLRREKITYPRGEGKIEYEYREKSVQPTRANCKDNFFDKSSRVVNFRPVQQ